MTQRVGRLQREERPFGSHGKSSLFGQGFVPCDQAIDIIGLLPFLLHLAHPGLIAAISRQIIVQILFIERYVQLFCFWSGLTSVDDAEGRLVICQYGMVVLCCHCLIAAAISCLLLPRLRLLLPVGLLAAVTLSRLVLWLLSTRVIAACCFRYCRSNVVEEVRVAARVLRRAAVPAALELLMAFLAGDGIVAGVVAAAAIDEPLHHLAVRFLLVSSRTEATSVANLSDELRISHQTLHALVLLLLILLLVISIIAACGLRATALAEVIIHEQAHLLELLDLLGAKDAAATRAPLLSIHHQVVQVDLSSCLVCRREVYSRHVLLGRFYQLSVVSDEHHWIQLLLLGAVAA